MEELLPVVDMMHSLKRRIQKMKTWQIVSVIVLFGLILRLIFFSGMGISDSLAYSSAANDLNEGKGIDEKSVLTLSTRIGITATTTLGSMVGGEAGEVGASVAQPATTARTAMAKVQKIAFIASPFRAER